MKFIIFIFTSSLAFTALSQIPSSEELLKNSIRYHDPLNYWPKFQDTLRFFQLNPNGIEQGSRTIFIDHINDQFMIQQQISDNIIERKVKKEKAYSYLNGSVNFTTEDSARFRINSERAFMYRDYYDYLYGLPMKLKDPGTIIDPEVEKSDFFGKACYKLRVRYEKQVGKDTWDFFFNPNNYALIGYRFYHDESKNDGEYIRLFGEEEISGIKMPKNRFWYYNSNDQFLGADYLMPSPKKPQSKFGIQTYKNARRLDFQHINNSKVFGLYLSTNWFEDQQGLWYILRDLAGAEYMKIDFRTMEPSPLFDKESLLLSLNKWHADSLGNKSMNFTQIEVYMDSVHFSFKGKRFNWIPSTKELKEISRIPERDSDISVSPDSVWKAFSSNYNLFIQNIKEDSTIQLSFDGKEHYTYASYYGWYDKMKGEHGKRPERFFVDWSPDGKYLQSQIVDTRNASKMYMLDFSVDTLFRPELYAYYRGSPGDTNMVYNIPMIYDLSRNRWLDLDLPRATHINNISIRWSEIENRAFISIPKRGFQEVLVLNLDLTNGQMDTLVHETSKTNIDDFRYWEIGDYLFYLSEKSGWRQLYKVSLLTKKEEAVTKGDFFINDIVHFDEDNKWIYYMASGTGDAPTVYHQLLYKIRFDGSERQLLTPEKMHHEVNISENGLYIVDNMSSIAHPTKTVLRSTEEGKIITTIAEANIDGILEEGWIPPMSFQAIARDGETPIFGALWLPTDFNPARKYPVIDHSYTGPHTQMFPKDFRTTLRRNNQLLAELGFIVIQLDGMGTYGRSKSFHDVSYKNMGKNLEDHVLAIRQLGEKYDWIDTNRVGIFGHSAGGYDAAHALLAYPDFYKVAVSSSADHDFRMEKAWWPEMYMGWPVDSTYHEVSNVTMAGHLKGKLLITHGAMDDNVNASATFKLAEALIKANKEFDLLILPSQRHGYKGISGEYFRKKRMNYFIEHLLEEEPIWNIDVKSE